MKPGSPLDFRNTNALWCSVLVETLVRLGARHAVTCPGSRSTPLTIALARHPRIEAIPLVDERSAAFFALGLAKRHRRPTVLVCTSGTAAANFLPAVIEAKESRVPLLVITADRPPEMRECRSGQTIDQQKIFGAFVGFYHELAVPEASLGGLRYLRQTAAHAWNRCLGPDAGPVHLNAPFRDPLPPLEDNSVLPLRSQLKERDFFRHLEDRGGGLPRPVAASKPASALAALRAVERGLIVAGPAQPEDAGAYCRAVAKLARGLGWPVLADALSPLRQHASLNPNLVSTYDCLLRSAASREALGPTMVLSLGEWPTSKRLRGWLQEQDPRVVMLGRASRNEDALHLRTTAIGAGVEEFAAAACWPARRPGSWLRQWMAIESRTRRRLSRALESEDAMFEGKASWLLNRSLPRGTAVVIANSMPVRDAEYFWLPGDRRHGVYFNRGANGIDGTLSTALGVAHGQEGTVLVTGDLAFLHDANGMLAKPKLRGSLTVVLVNNRGGGIFEHLPVSRFDPPFEEYFATPQQVDFSRLCAAHGIEHRLVKGWGQFTRLVSRLPGKGIRVLELRTDRKADAALRQRLLVAAAG